VLCLWRSLDIDLAPPAGVEATQLSSTISAVSVSTCLPIPPAIPLNAFAWADRCPTASAQSIPHRRTHIHVSCLVSRIPLRCYASCPPNCSRRRYSLPRSNFSSCDHNRRVRQTLVVPRADLHTIAVFDDQRAICVELQLVEPVIALRQCLDPDCSGRWLSAGAFAARDFMRQCRTRLQSAQGNSGATLQATCPCRAQRELARNMQYASRRE